MPDLLAQLRDTQLAELAAIRRVADAVELMTRDTSAGHATIAEVRADVDQMTSQLRRDDAVKGDPTSIAIAVEGDRSQFRFTNADFEEMERRGW